MKKALALVVITLSIVGCSASINTTPDQYTKNLILNCQAAQIDVVKNFIAKKANVNAVSDDGDSPLIAICRILPNTSVSLIAIAQALLDAGANPNISTKMGTPLLYAILVNNIPMINFLVSKGANVNLKYGEGGMTALLSAARTGASLEIIKLLIEHGANINAQSTEGYTALIYAAASRKNDTIEYLISKGANQSTKDKNGNTYNDYLAGTAKTASSGSPAGTAQTASSGSPADWDRALDQFDQLATSYEQLADQYVAAKGNNGDSMSIMNKSLEFLQKYQALATRLDSVKSELTSAQVSRLISIESRLANAAQKLGQ
jgi:ankyrin repeat protein